MTLQLSTYVETSLLPVLYKGAVCPAAPTGHVLRLYTTAGTDAAGGTELSGNGYAPMPLAGLLGTPQVAGEDVAISNIGRIESAEATGAWPEATHWGVTDGSGDWLLFGAITDPQTVAAGERFVAQIGEFDVSLSGALALTGKTAVLNWLWHGQAITPATASQIALYDAADVEVSTSGTGYSRQAITLGAVTDAGDGSHEIANTNAVEVTPSGNWGTVARIGVLAGDGTVLARGALAAAKSYGTGSIFQLPAGDLQLALG